jgi:5'-nucleotidase/UDP-sugar diphosphatase
MSLTGRRGPSPSLLLALLLSWLLLGCQGCASHLPAARPAAGTGSWNLTIFHTNDIHGAFLPEPAEWRDDHALVGGMIALAWHLAEERSLAPVSLLLDGGDFMTGNPICDIAEDGVLGGGLVDMMNAAGYDAGVVGNHEFDHGLANAEALVARASFPILAADILDEHGDHPFPYEPVVFERGDLRVGVMGVSCSGLFSMTAHDLTAGLSLQNQAAVVRSQIRDLDPRTDLLVLITHDGIEQDEALARELSGSGLDVIIGAHSHTRLEEPRLVGGILIVQAGSHLQYLGRLDLRVEDDHVAAYAGKLVPLLAEGAEAGPLLTALVERNERRIEQEFGVVIGTLTTDWERGREESNIGDWLTDRMRERAGADVAFLNSGSIRKNLPAGPIRLLDVQEILPFSNTLISFELTGEQLLTILTCNARAQVTHDHGLLQVSGVRYAFREVGDHVEVEQVTVGGQPLVRERVYRAAAPDYVVLMADRYFCMPAPATEPVGVMLTAAIVDAVRAAVTVHAEVDGRIRDLTGRK